MNRPIELPPHWARLAAAPPTLKQPTMKGGDEKCCHHHNALSAEASTPSAHARVDCSAEPVAFNPLRSSAKPGTVGKRRKVMNKTESAFSKLMEEAKRIYAIDSWHFEGMTLRWGALDSISYTPDFLVFEPAGIRLIETKGAKLWKDTSQKFKAARNQWPQFTFEMWQLKNREWKQLY